ncbi:phosphoribosyltransferase [Pseudomonas zhanjiangensis]|uniref:Phosphoribosyltransferase n=1 Tax=Pseudomonas zhanjiangensis TaxID=3239015 RepID=A0ABV3YWH0_9PSED
MNTDPTMPVPIPDRVTAGRALAESLGHYRARPQAIVLALPRGGVPVAYEIASRLQLPLDLMLVRKLGVPGHAELAMGAIASGGIRVLNRGVLASLFIDQAAIEAVAEREAEELQRRDRAYRGERPYPQLRDREVILVDDGLATGATMQAAVKAVRQHGPARIVVAVPVAPPETVAELRSQVDEVVCPCMPDSFVAIGRWYLDFSQTSDREVQELLQRAWQEQGDSDA